MVDMAPPGSSSSSRVELAALIARCVALAEGAGALIHEVYHQSGAVAVTYKGGGSSDPVTTADWRAQRHIAGSLALAYPGLLVIGEEDEEAVAAQDDVPLDPGAGLGAVLPEHQLPAEHLLEDEIEHALEGMRYAAREAAQTFETLRHPAVAQEYVEAHEIAL